MLAQRGRSEIEVHCAAQGAISLRFVIGQTKGRAFQPTFDSIFFQTSTVAESATRAA
jgi:hypothetical protein